MRALIDVSIIPAGADKRTGLARLALSLSQALAALGDLCVSTSAWGSLAASQDFAAVREEFPGLHGISPRSTAWERFCVEQQRLAADSQALTRAFWHRASQITNRLRNALRGISIDQIDVTHSTYPAFPRVVRQSGRPAVLTLHDLMPLVATHLDFPVAYAGIVRPSLSSLAPHKNLKLLYERQAVA
jgi:hypothetical protein